MVHLTKIVYLNEVLACARFKEGNSSNQEKASAVIRETLELPFWGGC